jgi:hypothetical protein
MTDVRFEWLLRTQDDAVSWWQLAALGWSPATIKYWLADEAVQQIHDGVYVRKHAPLTRRQRWFAATLTQPGTLLGGHSAGACWGFRPWSSPIESVVRFGSGGPRMLDGVYVRRSDTLADEIAWKDGIPITSVERTLIDLSSHLSPDQRGKAVREAIRLKLTTPAFLLAALDRHRGRRGTRPLRELAVKYATLPLDRTRSDAEGLALERLFDAGLPIPAVNEVVGGYEADLIDHGRKLIVEIDGPQFHLFAEEDELRDAAWADEGYRTVRVPSHSVYERP